MSERTQFDDAVDDAIEELIDDNTSGFHLVTTKRTQDGLTWDQTWFDDPVEIDVSDSLDIYSSTFALYCMAKLTLDRLQQEHSHEVTMEDVCHSILAVDEEIEYSDVTVWDYHELE